MRTPRKNKDAEASPPVAARGRRAHAGQPAVEPDPEGSPPPEHQAPAEPSEPARAATARSSARPAGHRVHHRPWRLRPRTVRAKIVSLLMVPVVSLLALWGFATVTTAQGVVALRHAQRVDEEVHQPVLAALNALQDERRAAARQVAAPGATRATELRERIRRTDAAVGRLRLDPTHTVGDAGGLPGDVAARVNTFVRTAEGLAGLRTAALDGRADWDRAYGAYTEAVTAAFAVSGALTRAQGGEQAPDARALLEFGRAGEMLSREDVLLTSAHLTGRFTEERLRAFSGAAQTRRVLTASSTDDLPAVERGAWERLSTGTDHIRLARAEDRISAASPGRPAAQAVPSADWDDTVSSVRGDLAAFEADARAAAADRADPFHGGALTPGGVAVVLGLVAVAASLVISVRIGRGLVVELVSLRNTALGIARRKLPEAMRRLRAGEEIDVRAEAPPEHSSQDEIGQVGEALAIVHRAALSAAAERAELASGISGVFVNLARRSQVLVHRQLNLLDNMERRADDPGELGDLFRLDHLTTRMRRHAESLIILSGAAPGRAWRMPVPLSNVVRAAVSEIEDYARVEVRRLPETAVTGGAVADLTHLLAELIENAAQFSPPHTKVRVVGEPVGNGYALEIEDRGLGMGKETLAEANARIARSEALDLFDSDRLGLFVVNRLASRHDIKVHLRTSPYGGTTAVVLLPTDLLQATAAQGRGTPANGPENLRAGPPSPGRTGARATGRANDGEGRIGNRPPGDAPAARGREEAHRAEARRFGRPPGPYPSHRGGPPPRLPGGPTPPAGAGRGAATPPPTGSPSVRLPQQADGTRPQPPTRPTALPPPGARPESGTDPGGTRPPIGVTELHRHGPPPVPPLPSERTPAAPTGGGSAGRPEPAGQDAPDGELPRRVRQASLVPQLREVLPPAAAPAPAGTDVRTPERVRDRMAAYRDGWQRGGGVTTAPRRPLGTGHDTGPGNALPDPRSEGDDT
ncbi:nitrate- and nitrite sensing domain-containing protein [Streptomyces sp. NPDC058877]|uniref:sensor histidine kinase n=1 Tax=Streptomyces sp. NPDC058877 TaxID=3346665 RepID=UPI003676E0B0